MNKRLIGLISLIIIFSAAAIFAQHGDPTLLKNGKHNGNRAGITFKNDGSIAGFQIGTDIRGEWPLGSGYNYIGDLTPLVGVEFVTTKGVTLQSVTISRGPRTGQSDEKNNRAGEPEYFWGWNPIPGFVNPEGDSPAMSHLPETWPIGGWTNPGEFPEVTNYVDEEGKTEWWGYFGRGITQADQESYFVADDQSDDEFNAFFAPDANDPSRKGMALQLRQRGFQWSSFLAEDAIFWLYDIKNEGTTTYKRANFGTVVGTLAGGDGDSGDDLGFFDAQKSITYSWDSDGIGNKGQRVGYVGYAFLESPGNPFDGIDNDGDSKDNSTPRFESSSFDAVTYNTGDKIVVIDEETYERTVVTVGVLPDTVYSLGKMFVIDGTTSFREGHIDKIVDGVAVPHISAVDGYDNDLDGLIDENESIHLNARIVNSQEPLKYANYITGAGTNDPLIDEQRDNDIDEDGDWDTLVDDLGVDGLGPDDANYPGPDFGEGDGMPTQGEPNFGRTDPDESDQIGLTAFNFFEVNNSPSMDSDSTLWARMTPGRFDEVPGKPQDGDFLYASGFFPLAAGKIERFSVSLLFGEDLKDIQGNQSIVQQIYNSGYKFPQPPKKPKLTIAQEDGNVALYWDGNVSENTKDFITKKKDFQGYKIYRSTDAGFQDARKITNARGVLTFDKPIAQFDKKDGIKGYFTPSASLFQTVGGTSYYLGEDNGIVNKFVDSTVTPGQTYYYAVVAYDAGDDTLDIFPSENSKFIFRESSGKVTVDVNTGYITPSYRPVGYKQAKVAEITKSDSYTATGKIEFELIDDSQIVSGKRYQLVFSDTSNAQITRDYSILDMETPDTVYVPEINETYFVSPLDSAKIPSGVDSIVVNGIKVKSPGTAYIAGYDTLINKATRFLGATDIVEGFRLQIYNDWKIKVDTNITGFEGISSAIEPSYAISTMPASVNGATIANDYVLEFSNQVVTQSVPDTLGFDIIPARDANFKVKNLSTGKYIDFVYFVISSVATTHNIYFKERIDGEYVRSWRIDIRYRNVDAPLETSGTLTLGTTKPFNRRDIVQFVMQGAEIDKNLAKADLSKIKVVPNPYIVTHKAEARLLSSQTSGRGEREIRFTRVPPGAKISIFTVRGEKIRELYQDEIYVGDVFWNLRTSENLDVAYGVYVFVVEAPGIGKKIGKFALIK